MRLDSVRELKAELLSLPTTLTESVAAAPSFTAFSATRATAGRTMSGIALGVAPVQKQYLLAVRLQKSSPLVTAMTEQIRQRARGEVDVQFVGNIVKFADQSKASFYRKRRRPLRIGSSISDISPDFFSAGTLGCFVVRRRAPHYIGMLTNNHVIAGENSTRLGSPLVQSGTLDGGDEPDDTVGELGKFIKLRSRSKNFIDVAVGDLYEGIDYDPRQIGNLGKLSGQGDAFALPEKATVHKVGRTTGQTAGRITAFDVDNVQVEYDIGVLRFDNQIEIEGAGRHAFSDAGDSGSLIVDSDLKAIGLLFAGGDSGGSNGKGLTYANPIQPVLDGLHVDLER
jgi:hypothetical protein